MKEGTPYFKSCRPVVSEMKRGRINQHILPYMMGKMNDPYYNESSERVVKRDSSGTHTAAVGSGGI
jgi:hypothetical protein